MHIQRVSRLLDAVRADAVYITSPQNRYYFSGFTGTYGFLVLTRDRRLLFTDSRYRLQAAQQCPAFEIRDVRDDMYGTLNGYAALGIEEEYMTVADYDKLTQKTKCRPVPVSRDVSALRKVKDAQELQYITEAARIADSAFAHIVPQLAPGKTERALALELETFMRRAGAEDVSFETIFASGERSAMPHGTASDKPLHKGDFVTMDFGCKYKGYCSDMTRTVVLGRASERQREIYEIVLEAQRTAIAAMRPGASCREVDAAARDVIAAHGYGDNFGHSLGHSLGLDIHESPACSPKSVDTLEAGMLMTAEPGIYVDGFGGVRIEDLLIVMQDGTQNLTASPKELLELD